MRPGPYAMNQETVITGFEPAVCLARVETLQNDHDSISYNRSILALSAMRFLLMSYGAKTAGS